MASMGRMNPLKVWILAARPKTLGAAVSPVIIGTALAYRDGGFHLPSFAAALAGAILIQIGTNFANDLFDHEKGADTDERVGPLRVTQAGLVSPAGMKLATGLIFGLAAVVGIYLIYRGGWAIALIGLLSILFGILYTGGPYPLGYAGAGDVLVLIFFGPVAVAGTYYVQTLDINAFVILAGLPPGLIATALLVVNNLRDVETDAATGKKTLAVRFGPNFARMEYLLVVAAACFMPAVFYMSGWADSRILFALLSVLFAIPPVGMVLVSKDGAVLNRALAGTGRLLLAYGLLFAAGLVT